MQKPLQRFPHGCGRVWFGEVRVRPETADPLRSAWVGIAADYDNGKMRRSASRADSLDELEAVHVRHLQIGDDGRQALVLDQLPCLPAGGGVRDPHVRKR